MTDFRTTDLCDEHEGAVRVGLPGLRHFGGRRRFHGRVSTIRCHDDNSRVREAVAEQGHGGVLVVDGGGSWRCALLGDQLAARAVASGWSGIIINGCVRDSEALAALDLGVLALGTHPRRSEKRGHGERDVPLELGDIEVRPGDHVYADEDGWIVSQAPLP